MRERYIDREREGEAKYYIVSQFHKTTKYLYIHMHLVFVSCRRTCNHNCTLLLQTTVSGASSQSW